MQLYNIVTIATRWKSFRIRTSFIGNLDPLERIGELWPLSREDWLLLQLTRIGYKDLSSGDYDSRRGLGGMAPSLERSDLSFSLSTLTWIGLVCRLDLCEYFFLEHFVPNPFIPQTCLWVIFVLGLGALMALESNCLGNIYRCLQIFARLQSARMKTN